jgi:hypothetical protein
MMFCELAAQDAGIVIRIVAAVHEHGLRSFDSDGRGSERVFVRIQFD